MRDWLFFVMTGIFCLVTLYRAHKAGNERRRPGSMIELKLQNNLSADEKRS